ncbi:MAG: hypothetical protein NC832_00455 [Candidatus Omnitrophica bacterium]|nr:hypothetical protein [Candidatus Omnitrophota bacterium]
MVPNYIKKLKTERVLFVNHSIYPFEKTGSPLSTYEQVKGLKEKGIDVGGLIPDFTIKNRYIREYIDGIPVYKIPGLNQQNIWLTSFFKPEIIRNYLLLIKRLFL